MGAWNTNFPRQVEVLLGACILLRREALDYLNVLLDEDYFIYSEEVDLCHRLRRAGWRIYWEPRAKIIHYGGQSTQQVAPQMFLYLYKGKVLYFNKNFGWTQAQIYKLILLIASIPRLLIKPITPVLPQKHGQKLKTVCMRYWALVKALPHF